MRFLRIAFVLSVAIASFCSCGGGGGTPPNNQPTQAWEPTEFTDPFFYSDGVFGVVNGPKIHLFDTGVSDKTTVETSSITNYANFQMPVSGIIREYLGHGLYVLTSPGTTSQEIRQNCTLTFMSGEVDDWETRIDADVMTGNYKLIPGPDGTNYLIGEHAIQAFALNGSDLWTITDLAAGTSGIRAAAITTAGILYAASSSQIYKISKEGVVIEDISLTGLLEVSSHLPQTIIETPSRDIVVVCQVQAFAINQADELLWHYTNEADFADKSILPTAQVDEDRLYLPVNQSGGISILRAISLETGAQVFNTTINNGSNLTLVGFNYSGEVLAVTSPAGQTWDILSIVSTNGTVERTRPLYGNTQVTGQYCTTQKILGRSAKGAIYYQVTTGIAENKTGYVLIAVDLEGNRLGSFASSEGRWVAIN